jgi:hypothetical protein
VRRLECQLAEVHGIGIEMPRVTSCLLHIATWREQPAQHCDIPLTAEDDYQGQSSYSIAWPPEDELVTWTRYRDSIHKALVAGRAFRPNRTRRIWSGVHALCGDVSMLLVEPGHERQDGRLRTLRRIGTMTENGSEVVLDGNAAAGLLQEIFVREVTTAQIECAACGFTAALGSLRLYAMPVGAVLRCTHCDGVVMTAVHTPYAHWLEMTGARCLRS